MDFALHFIDDKNLVPLIYNGLLNVCESIFLVVDYEAFSCVKMIFFYLQLTFCICILVKNLSDVVTGTQLKLAYKKRKLVGPCT